MASEDLTVRGIMVEDVITVLSKGLAVLAAQTMVRNRVRHLVVTESHGEVVGVLSERQVLKHFSAWLTKVGEGSEVQTLLPRCEVREIMAKPPITVTEGTSIDAAAAILASNKIGCLPVVRDGNRLVGLVTAVDVLKFIGRGHVPEPEEEFEPFRPPAFLSEDGKLTVPAGYFSQEKSEEKILVLLAYSPRSKRISVKLLAREQQGQDLLGARPATLTDKYLAIPAKDFLEHHNLNIRGLLTVAENKETGCLILSPVLKP